MSVPLRRPYHRRIPTAEASDNRRILTAVASHYRGIPTAEASDNCRILTAVASHYRGIPTAEASHPAATVCVSP